MKIKQAIVAICDGGGPQRGPRPARCPRDRRRYYGCHHLRRLDGATRQPRIEPDPGWWAKKDIAAFKRDIPFMDGCARG